MKNSTGMRWAGRVCWFFGVLTTMSALLAMGGDSIDPTATFLVAFGLQFVLTKAELPLVEGKVTYVKDSVGYIVSAVALVIDVLINLGGVGRYTMNWAQTETGQFILNRSPGTFFEFMSTWQFWVGLLITVVVSVFLALLPEKMADWANDMERTGRSGSSRSREVE